MGGHKKIDADPQSLAELSQVIEEYKAFRVEYRRFWKSKKKQNLKFNHFF